MSNSDEAFTPDERRMMKEYANELRTLSTMELVNRAADALVDWKNVLLKLALIVYECDRRGEPHELAVMFPTKFIADLRRIAAGQLLPQLFIRFGCSKAYQRMKLASISDQRRYLDRGVELPDGRLVSPDDVPPDQVHSVWDEDGSERSAAAQIAYEAYQRTKDAAPLKADRVGNWYLDWLKRAARYGPTGKWIPFADAFQLVDVVKKQKE